MKRSIILALAVVILVAGIAGSVLAVGPVRDRLGLGTAEAGTPYRNPVINADFADPAIMRASDGMYYAYATQTLLEGSTVNIHVARSRDLVHWKLLGDALPIPPAWSVSKQNLWAPDVVEQHGRYIMHLSVEPDKSDGMCIAVATSRKPTGIFRDVGKPLLCGPGISDIDPMAFHDPQTGKNLLFWGSGGSPIRVQELTADWLHFKPHTTPRDVLSADPQFAYENLIEGAWVHYRRGYYYLYYSGDACCGSTAHYAVMVARSRHATGPYVKMAKALHRPSSTIVIANQRWNAPGHNSVITDKMGEDWLVYHAVDLKNATIGSTGASRRPMLIEHIRYRGGWPYIEGSHPSSTEQTGPVTK